MDAQREQRRDNDWDYERELRRRQAGDRGANVRVVPIRKGIPQQERARRSRARRRAQRRRALLIRTMAALATVLFAGAALLAAYLVINRVSDAGNKPAADIASREEKVETPSSGLHYPQPACTVDYLDVNEYSRPGEPLLQVNDIFIHYTANPRTSAAQNRSYFESLKDTGETSASAHFIVGYEGEIVQCIPRNEIGYAVKGRNYDSISIECCYLDKNGRFTQETLDSLTGLTAWLLGEYGLTVSDVKRHYDEGGKNCPKYFVENETAWKDFLDGLEDYMEREERQGKERGNL